MRAWFVPPLVIPIFVVLMEWHSRPIKHSKLEILQRNTVMGKSMNPKMSGFRKWAEIHEPTKVDKARTEANEGGVTAAADVDQHGKTPNATTARPWLIPGASRG